MSSPTTVLARQHRADGCLAANEATSAGFGKWRYYGLCPVRENLLGHKPVLARIIRRDPKANVAIRHPMAFDQHHSTAAAKDVEAIARRIIA